MRGKQLKKAYKEQAYMELSLYFFFFFNSVMAE
jgi:hypothetical protein